MKKNITIGALIFIIAIGIFVNSTGTMKTIKVSNQQFMSGDHPTYASGFLFPVSYNIVKLVQDNDHNIISTIDWTGNYLPINKNESTIEIKDQNAKSINYVINDTGNVYKTIITTDDEKQLVINGYFDFRDVEIILSKEEK